MAKSSDRRSNEHTGKGTGLPSCDGNALDNVVNVTRAIDEGPVGALLIRVGLLCAAVAFLVGLDTSSINVAAPLIADVLRLSHADIGPIFSAALFGSLLGALGFGALADRFGRKRMLLIATLGFGAFTLATAGAGSFRSMLLVRFLAGIGLGGATPCFITLASEYAPASRRGTVTSLIWTAFPLGVITGSFLNAQLISAFGWRSIFLVGGVFPLLVALALLIWLPESARFLLATNRGAAAVRRIMTRVVPDLPGDASFVVDEEKVARASIGHLFSEGRAGETLTLWLCCFSVFGTGLGVFFWTPTLVRDHGIPLAAASRLLGLSGIGALAGSAVTGRLMARFGTTAILAPTFALGALATAALGYSVVSPATLAADLLVATVLIGGVGSSGVLALASGMYPTVMRSTGVGWATSMGRLGELLSPLLTGLLLSVGWTLAQVFVAISAALASSAVAVLLLAQGRARAGAR